MTSAAGTHNVRVALLGLGEVGQRLAADLRAQGVNMLAAYDIQFDDPGSNPAKALRQLDFVHQADSAEKLGAADLVISAVTAAECVPAARSVQASLREGTRFLDLNSVSPATRREAAAVIDGVGGCYIEAAVMSAIEPRGIASPTLLGGQHARHAVTALERLGFTAAEFCSAELGRVSAIKMCRSVIVKGTEALLSEALLAARHYGVEDAVLASLDDMLSGDDWPARARYMIGRSLQHGGRRAEEMREVARTVGSAGLEPWMSRAAAERQMWAADHADAVRHKPLPDLLDAVLRRQRERRNGTTGN